MSKRFPLSPRSTLALTAFALVPNVLMPSALAWTPALDETSAQTVLNRAYDRPASDTRPTYLSVNLQVEGGEFAQPDAVQLFRGGDACLTNWQAEPSNFETWGSRPQSVLVTGQADALFFEGKEARNQFIDLTAADALTEEARAGRLEDGLLRVDLAVSGLPSEETRKAYDVFLRSGEERVPPAKKSYVADWQQGENGLWSGTIVYYFDVNAEDGTQAFDPSGPAELLFRTEKAGCAYSVPLDLGSFI